VLLIALAGIWAMPPASAEGGSSPASGLQHDVVFADYPQYSRSLEVARRILSPLANLEIMRATAGGGLASQSIDLKKEKFAVYVPRRRPSKGYGVLAFIPPWQDARLPAGWGSALDESGVIFVCANKSGNDESIIGRRIPLALLAVYNITQSYPIDADRVYVGGFSGGSRVAMRVALGYPDVIRGALLNAGSDPIGNKDAVLPPGDLLGQFQSSSRIVYVTGLEDSLNIKQDMGSRGAMNAWCVFGTEVETMFGIGHEIATVSATRRALAALDRRPPVDAGKLAACRARIAKEMATDLEEVTQSLDRGRPHAAWRLLSKADARYAGLALPEITKLEQRVGSRP